MVTIAERISQLRTQKQISAIALSSALGWPRASIEKFEAGKQTPSKDQQQALAGFFGVSVAYLRGETNDPTRQDSWMDMIIDAQNEEPTTSPPPRQKRPADDENNGLLDAMLLSPNAQQALRKVILDVMRSPEAQEIIRRAVKDELRKK